MKYNIYFTKTAKCATETIREYLIQYAQKKQLSYNDKKYEQFYYHKNFNIVTNHIFNNIKSQKHFLQNKNDEYPSINVTSIRDPLDRLYSHYCYGHPFHKKGMDFNEWYVKTIKGKLHDSWPASRWGDRTSNYISNYMNVSTIYEFDEFYDFCFIKEYFDDSLTLFEKIINFTFEKISAKNINQKSKKKYQFDNEVIELFEENNQLDISLYNHIITKYLVLKN